MQLTKDAIDEFKQIYSEDYGITLTDPQALELATSFFTLMQAVFRPLPDEPCPHNPDMLECLR